MPTNFFRTPRPDIPPNGTTAHPEGLRAVLADIRRRRERLAEERARLVEQADRLTEEAQRLAERVARLQRLERALEDVLGDSGPEQAPPADPPPASPPSASAPPASPPPASAPQPQAQPQPQPDGSYVVESRSEAGKTYELRLVKGCWTCTCPAGMHGRACWHARAVEALRAAKRRQVAPTGRPAVGTLVAGFGRA